MPVRDRTSLYRTIWRWHFYAGLFVIPFILLLSVTGSIYLFKPDIDAWEEAQWEGSAPPPGQPVASPDARVAAALAAVPGARFHAYRLPRTHDGAAVVRVGTADQAQREVFVAADGKVAAIVDPDQRWSNWLARLHGGLLLGLPGGLVVETAASWAIVMILTGLYLWWPRGRGLAGVVWPRIGKGRRTLWRDLHAVTGFWVSGLALVLLLSGLPWTDGWATAFHMVRAELGWVSAAPQDWRGGLPGRAQDDHAGHAHHGGAMAGAGRPATISPPRFSLTAAVAVAEQERLPFPVVVQPPLAPAVHGPPSGNAWKIGTETQNRPHIRSLLLDPATGAVVGRTSFADRHPIDQAINYGIAWHEGQLLGRFNQMIGVLTALALITLAVSGTVLWWRRRPADGSRFTPPPMPEHRIRGVAALLLLPALLLPMMAASLLVVTLVDAVLSRWRLRAA